MVSFKTIRVKRVNKIMFILTFPTTYNIVGITLDDVLNLNLMLTFIRLIHLISMIVK